MNRQNLILGDDAMRLTAEREGATLLLRLIWNWTEIAYLILGIRGLELRVEFPSDWHEVRRGWLRIGLGMMKLAISFPWPRVVPDEYQCSGPTYGFTFFGDGLHLHWGKCKGRRGDPMAIIAMPWKWHHREHVVMSEPEQHRFTYVLKGGAVQNRIATIKHERRTWIRPWLPFRRVDNYIDVEFDKEVGEQSGSWKGGVLGCGYAMLPGESPRKALRRMERWRKF